MVVARGWEGGEMSGVSVLPEKVLKMDGADGSTTIQIYFMPLNCTLKVVIMVKCMLYVFYHNFQKEILKFITDPEWV